MLAAYSIFAVATTALATYGAAQLHPAAATLGLIVAAGFLTIGERWGRDRELLGRTTLQERIDLMSR